MLPQTDPIVGHVLYMKMNDFLEKPLKIRSTGKESNALKNT